MPIAERVRQAEEMMDSGQIEEAILILERCLEREPERVDVLEPLAFAYAAREDPVMAAYTFKGIAELVPERAEYLLYAAESLLDGGDRKGALACYEEYLAKRPKDRAVWVTLAELRAGSGFLSGAIEAYLAAEQLQTRTPQQLAIGQLYLRAGNLAQAQAWFGRALRGDSELRDEALLGLLETAVRSKRFQDAEALLDQIDAEYPGRLDQSDLDAVRDQLAEWRRRREAAREALVALEERAAAEQAAPEEEAVEPVQPVEWAAEEAAPEELVAEAEPEVPEKLPVTDLEESQPPVPEDFLSLARMERDNGRLAAAVRNYKAALVEDDNQPAVWAELSEVYLQAGNPDWARATASEAVRRDQDNPKFLLQYLRAAQRTMKPDKIIREMEDAYRRFPDQPEIILVLARAYRDIGSRRNARLLFGKFLELVPADDPLRGSVEIELQRLGG